MPKVDYVKAAKDYPEFGITKGAMHYVWSMKRQRGGVTKRSLTRPRESQLTESEYKTQAHALNERLQDLSEPGELGEIETAVEDIKSEAQTLCDEQQEKLDAMPEGLQQGPTGELIAERIAALEAFIGELEGVDFDPWEPVDPDPDEEIDEDAEPVDADGVTESEYLAAKLEEVQDISLDVT